MRTIPSADREGDVLDTKYPYVCHAEMNAVLNSIMADLNGCSVYVALFPCNECAKVLIQSGIKEVVYLSDKYAETDSVIASKKLFELCNVKTRKLSIENHHVVIDWLQGVNRSNSEK